MPIWWLCLSFPLFHCYLDEVGLPGVDKFEGGGTHWHYYLFLFFHFQLLVVYGSSTTAGEIKWPRLLWYQWRPWAEVAKKLEWQKCKSLQGKPQEPGQAGNAASPCPFSSSFFLVSPGENLPAMYPGKQGVQDQALLSTPPSKVHGQIQKQTDKLLMHP